MILKRLRRSRRFQRRVRPVWLGTLRRTRPISRNWGYDRGIPVDRYYIDGFLSQHRQDVRGRVLEVKEPLYTERYGAGVDRIDVLDIDPGNPRATIVADLSAADGLPESSFDCFILTQTLHCIFDVHAAIRHSHRLLRPGGVLLATVPVASRGTDPPLADYWRLTRDACTRLFGDVFGAEHIDVQPRGNVLACVASLMGLAHDELTRDELDAVDPLFPLIVTVRATRRSVTRSS